MSDIAMVRSVKFVLLSKVEVLYRLVRVKLSKVGYRYDTVR